MYRETITAAGVPMKIYHHGRGTNITKNVNVNSETHVPKQIGQAPSIDHGLFFILFSTSL
jgi:hypothetical protein